jgi:peroxiredoxin
LADAGVRVLAIGQDPPAKLTAYVDRYGQRVQTLSEAPPYDVSNAWGISAVPSVFLVATDGIVKDAFGAWSREAWNRIAQAAGAPGPISTADDGLPAFRPG